MMDLLNISVRMRAMEGAVPLSIFAEMPSGPDALLVLTAMYVAQEWLGSRSLLNTTVSYKLCAQ